jgi:uncharacterized repeat protein (TIGR02543 family)
MKTLLKKNWKILVVALVIVATLSIGAIAVFGKSEPKVSIERYNLSFSDTVYLTYAVKFDNLPEGAEKGILAWDKPQSSYTIESSGYTKINKHTTTVNFGTGTCYVYDYKGIAAKEMTDSVYIVGYVKDGDNYTYSELSKFGVLDYAYNKLGFTGTPTTNEKFANLLQAMLEYGAEAQKYFDYNTENLATDKYYLVNVSGGVLDDLAAHGLYRVGVEVSVTAPQSKNGENFIAWVDDKGEYVSFDSSFTYTIPERNSTLTAVYTASNLYLALDGGTLPAGAVTEYDPAQDTELPTPTKTNAVFMGWYTTQRFDDGIRVEKISKGTSGTVILFAKWALVNCDFEGSNIDISEETAKNASYNKVNVNCQKVGTSAKTVTDGDNKYLQVSVCGEDSIVSSTSSSYNLTHFTEQAISFKIDLAKIKDVDRLNLSINIATTGGAYGQLRVASMNRSNGEVKLVGGSKVLAVVGEDFVTLRIVVDFASGDGIAYDENGNELDRVKLTVPTAKEGNTQPETLADWQKVAKEFLLYCYMTNSAYSTTGTAASLAYDNIVIVEGNCFAKN